MQPKTLALLLSTLVISLSSCCQREAEEIQPQQQQNQPASGAVKQETAPDAVAQETTPAAQSEQEFSLDSGMTMQEEKIKEMEAMCAEAEKLAGEDKIPEALKILRAAMKREDFQALKSDLFFRTLYMLINLKKIEQAQDLYLEYSQIEEEQELAQSAFGIIEQTLAAEKKFPELALWCVKLSEMPRTGNFLPALADWHFKALLAMKVPNASTKLLEHYETRLPSPIWNNFANTISKSLLQENMIDEAKNLLKYLQSKLNLRPDAQPICFALQLQILAAEKKWPESCAFLAGLISETDDNIVTPLYNQLQNHLFTEHLYELADSSSKLALEQKEKPKLRQAASRSYMRAALQQENAPIILKRIIELRDMGFDNTALVGWLSEAHSTVMRQGTQAELESMLAIAKPIMGPSLKADNRSVLAGIMLDLMFKLELFSGAAAVLDAGVPEQDKAWHESMKNKVLAHLALKEGRKEEALERFTRFLNESVTKFEETYDPITGERVTRNMVLALNHKRIGEIQAELGKKAEAEASFENARKFYDAALKTAKPNSEQEKRLKAERDSMPAPEK